MDLFSYKILLCDDSLLVRKKLKDALEEIGFKHVFEATDGLEAVQFCKSEKPNVVLMDIVMPNKDGLEALQEIKEINPETIVIMASSVGTQSNLIKAIKLGANNFIQKPMTAEAVLDIISKAVNELGVE